MAAFWAERTSECSFAEYKYDNRLNRVSRNQLLDRSRQSSINIGPRQAVEYSVGMPAEGQSNEMRSLDAIKEEVNALFKNSEQTQQRMKQMDADLKVQVDDLVKKLNDLNQEAANTFHEQVQELNFLQKQMDIEWLFATANLLVISQFSPAKIGFVYIS